MPDIRVSNIEKSFDGKSVLDELSFEVDTGEIFGLLGPNGAGKTTTIDILTGVNSPDSGDVSVLGMNPDVRPVKVRKMVGILPEKESPPSFFTPREYFQFVGDIRGMNPEVVRERVENWADRLDFDDVLDVLSKDLSRGQQQKIMLVQALIHKPSLVFIDEPLANLDPLMQERVKNFIKQYNDLGHTIVLCTHQVEVAQELCTSVGIIKDGSFSTRFDPRQLNADESVRELYLNEMESTLDTDQDLITE